MKVHPPLCITSRLIPGFRFEDGSSISIQYAKHDMNDSRTQYHYFIDTPDGRTYERHNLQSDIRESNPNLQRGLSNLLLALRKAAYDFGDGEESSFDEWVPEWADNHFEELDNIVCEMVLSDVGLIEEPPKCNIVSNGE